MIDCSLILLQTIYIVDLEEEVQFVSLAAMNEEIQSFQQLIEANRATAVRIK